MICSSCKEAADCQGRWLKEKGETTSLYPHPEDCGCTCAHYPVGTIQIQRKEKS